jgi:hypothetical protein
MSIEQVDDLIARNYTIDYLLFEMSKRISERHTHRFYLKKMNEGLHNIEAAWRTHVKYLEMKEGDLTAAVENVKFFRTNLNPTEKEMQKMAYFKLENTHISLMKKRKVNDMPADIEHRIVGDIPVTLLEKYGIIERLAFGFRADVKESLSLHFSQDREAGWNFEVILNVGKSKDMIGTFSIPNKDFLELRRTANSEAKLEVKGVGVFRLGPFVLFLNSRIREQVV